MVAGLISVAGCESERSLNPLSPQIAGPIAGVTITAPTPISPIPGSLIEVASQPIALTFANAISNSVRPFWHHLEVSNTDGFVEILQTMTDIAPGNGGQVGIQLPDALEPEQVYYWRVRALDGANTSAFSIAGSFELYTPVVLEPPTVSSPTGGSTISTPTAVLVATHGAVTGPAASVTYRFEIATDIGFGNLVAVLTVPQSEGDTTSVSPGQLPYGQTYHWRARAISNDRTGSVSSAWSSTASFRTPPQPVVIDPPTAVSPVGGTTTPSLRPTLIVSNGAVGGQAGTVTYRFEVSESPSFSPPTTSTTAVRSGGATTAATLATNLTAGRTYYWRVNARNGTVTSSYSATQTFRTPSVSSPSPGPSPTPPPPGGRTPDPPPGQLLPVPNMAGIVNAVAAEFPGALANSCQHAGGTWEFLDRVVDRLRQFDTRWGYNCKRGDCNDPSQDIAAYHTGAGPTVEGVGDTRTVDVIVGHCGPDPGPQWDVQGVYGPDVVRWTSRGRF